MAGVARFGARSTSLLCDMTEHIGRLARLSRAMADLIDQDPSKTPSALPL